MSEPIRIEIAGGTWFIGVWLAAIALALFWICAALINIYQALEVITGKT